MLVWCSLMLWMGLARSDALPAFVSQHDKWVHWMAFFGFSILLQALLHTLALRDSVVAGRRTGRYAVLMLTSTGSSLSESPMAERLDHHVRPPRHAYQNRMALTILLLLGASIGSELVQILVGYRTLDGTDMLMNLAGCLAGVVLFQLLLLPLLFRSHSTTNTTTEDGLDSAF